MTNKRHDLVIIRIQDIFEKDMDRFHGLISFQDPETFEIANIDINDDLKEQYRKYKDEKNEEIKKFTQKNSIDLLEIDTESNITKELIGLFKKRQKRF
jgi:hypothetical protein